MEDAVPRTRYAKSGDVNIAYQVLGEGPFDLVWVPGSFSHVEQAWEIPSRAAFYRRLASFSRLILFDKRGTGMSDRTPLANLETRMDDVRAVMDAAGSDRAALVGVSEGGPMSMLFAATYPDRVWALVLYATFARGLWAPDYPWGDTAEEWRRDMAKLEDAMDDPSYFDRLAGELAPSADPESMTRFALSMRQSGTPAARLELMQMVRDLDVRHVLPAIRVPTLVMNRTGDAPTNVGGSKYLAREIAGARYVELEGVDHAPNAGDAKAVLDAIDGFLAGAWAAAPEADDPDTVLATVLFTDIVGSTAQMHKLGDRAWASLLADHNSIVRQNLSRFRGVEVDTAGDGFFARFDGPARAIRCAREIVGSVQDLGLEVRAGLHTGECQVADGKVAGIAISIGARVASEAGPGEVLVSSTVHDLVAGSGLRFADRGLHALKGLPGEWRLYAVA